MSEVIKVIAEKCVGCNACIRTCPANEANITKILEDGKSVTIVNAQKCINCGECIRTCQHGARDYVDDTDRFFIDMKSHRISLLVTPSIKTAFPETWKAILGWFKSNGISAIYDVSYGADICSWAHLRAIEQGMIGNTVTQPCAAIVNYIEKYQPSLLKNLSPVHSPLSCEAIYLRDYLKISDKMAALTPCIAKKSEFEATKLIEYNVTFQRIKEYFEKNKIDFPHNQTTDYGFPFDDQQGLVGSIYPRPGGLRDNIWLHNPDINITTSEGVHKVYPELDMYAKMPEFKHPEVFDVLSCEFGCNTGPASGHSQSVFDIMTVMREVEKDSKKKRKTGLFKAGADKQFKKFDENLQIKSFFREYDSSKAESYIPSMADLRPTFELMGKFTDTDKHYDCHACGYKSCVDMATAIYRGLNVPDNCIVHAKASLYAQHRDLEQRHQEISAIADKVSDFATKLLADIENIYASLYNIDGTNHQSASKSKIVQGILVKIIDYCKDSEESMGKDDIEHLIFTLEQLNGALTSLDSTVNQTVSSSDSIRNAMQQVADATTELNVMVTTMVQTFTEKY